VKTMQQIAEETAIGIPKRGYVWQCAIPANKERFVARPEAIKQPCGHWNYYYGKQWAGAKNARWQGICQNPDCKRKRQLNLGIVRPESPNYYNTKEAAVRKAQDLNWAREQKAIEDAKPKEKVL